MPREVEELIEPTVCRVPLDMQTTLGFYVCQHRRVEPLPVGSPYNPLFCFTLVQPGKVVCCPCGRILWDARPRTPKKEE